MNRWKYTLLLWMMLVGVASAESSLKIVVSIPPLAHIVKALGQDQVEVVSLLAEGDSPHHFDPSPSQIKQVHQADVLIQLGSGLEQEHMSEALWKDCSGDKITLVTQASLQRLHVEEGHGCCEGHDHDHKHAHEEGDPHVWLSLVNLQKITAVIAEELIRRLPKQELNIKQREAQYVQSLLQLDQTFKQLWNTYHIEQIFVIHPAWAYFARDYGLKQTPIHMKGIEPSVKAMKQFVDQVNQSTVAIMIGSPQYRASLAQRLAGLKHALWIEINPVSYNLIGQLEGCAKDLEQKLAVFDKAQGHPYNNRV